MDISERVMMENNGACSFVLFCCDRSNAALAFYKQVSMLWHKVYNGRHRYKEDFWCS